MLLEVVDSILGCEAPPASTEISVDFLDVPPAHQFHDQVNTVARNGVTAGCGGGNYCPDTPVTRAQMAVFLLKAKFGAGYVAPGHRHRLLRRPGSGAFAADSIEELAARGITGGCGGGNYCPEARSRARQMAVFLLKTHARPATRPRPWARSSRRAPGVVRLRWINELSTRGITGGCGGGNYCPGPRIRGDRWRSFSTNTFSLQ